MAEPPVHLSFLYQCDVVFSMTDTNERSKEEIEELLEELDEEHESVENVRAIKGGKVKLTNNEGEISKSKKEGTYDSPTNREETPE